MKSYSPNSKINKTVSIKTDLRNKSGGGWLELEAILGWNRVPRFLPGAGKDQIRYTSGVQVIVYMMFIGMLYQFKFSQFSETQKNPSTSRGPSDKERGINQMWHNNQKDRYRFLPDFDNWRLNVQLELRRRGPRVVGYLASCRNYVLHVIGRIQPTHGDVGQDVN